MKPTGPDRPLKVLHVVAPGPVGGLERVVQTLVPGQLGDGMEVHVAVILDLDRVNGSHFLDTINEAGPHVHAWPLPPRAYGRERMNLTDLCRSVRPDVVHTHGYRADVVDGLAAVRLGIPVVSTAHGFPEGGWKNRTYLQLQRRAHRRFSAVVGVSRPVADELRRARVPGHRIHCIPNAWSGDEPRYDRQTARRRLEVPEDGLRVGFVGRLSEEKGCDLFLDALARMGNDSVAASVIGDGPRRGVLEERAGALGLEDRVRWHGLVPGAGELMKAFDVFVLSSRTEGTPIVLFEAMAAGVLIVATKVGGVPDVLDDEEALLVEPDASELGNAIASVLADPVAGRQRADRARTRLHRDFAMEPWLRRYEDVYRLAIRGDSAPEPSRHEKLT
jgi:glycosyltransferase involved in cell wall biosynthesis